MKIVHVQKHPADAPHLLARAFEYEEAVAPSLPVGFEQMTVESFDAWKAAEIAAGWQPPPLTAEQQAAETAEENERALIATLATEAQAMIDGTGTQAERQRRVELWLGRLGKRLLKTGVIP